MNKKIIIAISIIIVLIFAGVIGYYFYQISPGVKIKKTLISEVSSVRKVVSDVYSSTYNSLYSKKILSNNKKATVKIKPTSTDIDISAGLSLNNKLKSSKENKYELIENILSNSKLSMKVDSNKDENYTKIDLSYSYNKERTNADIFIDNDNIYFKDKDLLNKYILIDNVKLVDILNSGVSLNDYNYLLAVFSKTINNTNIKENISSTEETVKIADKVINAKKDTLKVDEQLLKSFGNNLIKNILSDQNAINITSKLTNSDDVEELKENLVKVFSSLLSKELINNGGISISTYTTGLFPTFVMQTIDYSLDSKECEISLINSNVIDSDKHIIIDLDSEKITLNINENNNKKNIEAILEKGDNNYLLNIKGTMIPTKLDLTYKLTNNDNEMLNGTVKYEQSFESNKKDAKLELSFDASNMKIGKGTFKVETKTKQVSSVKKEEIQDSVKVREINLNDRTLFIKNMAKKLPSIMNLFNQDNIIEETKK